LFDELAGCGNGYASHIAAQYLGIYAVEDGDIEEAVEWAKRSFKVRKDVTLEARGYSSILIDALAEKGLDTSELRELRARRL
jgi:hypothetical protein